MFICKACLDCIEEHPVESSGRCEVCGKSRVCYDCPPAHARKRVPVEKRGLSEAAFILMRIAGFDRRSESRAMYQAIEEIRDRLKCRQEPKLVEIEGIWSDGSVRRKKFVQSSTGVAIMHLQALTTSEIVEPCKSCQDRPGKDGLGRKCKPCDGTGNIKTGKTQSFAPMLTRVFHDGLLVREWDQVNNRYNLELD